ncbi:SDR family oxidoreductase [Nocardia sp. NPDC023852]|uniref:SDR family oxidoreductase n=1 Tax=Nocardia sp. NPDC023852 TaxID=3154697 RepID=UPI0033FB27D0
MREKEIALVTGANKGLGREIARRLAAMGMTVLATARDEPRGRTAVAELAAGGAEVRFAALDVTDTASAAAVARRISAEYGRLDVLVNNAGVAAGAGHTAEEMRRLYETNVFGVVTVTNALLPLLRRAPTARIVNMSSTMGSLALHAGPNSPGLDLSHLAYSSSKTALNAVTLLYANHLRADRIKVNAVCPGYVATDLNQHSGVRTVEQGAEIAVRLATLDTDGPTGTFVDDNGAVAW